MMEMPLPSNSIFGTYSEHSREQRVSMLNYLRDAWEAQFGRPLGSLSVDLEALSPLYAPALTAKRLREFGDSLRPLRGRRPALGPNLFIPVGPDRGFVTPEGRVLLEVADSMGEVRLAEGRMLMSLVDFYATPRRDWISKTLTGGDLRPATIGFVIFLLLNGSTSEKTALRIPDSVEDEERLARAVIPVVNAFLTGMKARNLTGRELTRLRSNWAVSEARAQLPSMVRSEDVEHARRIFIAEGQEMATLNVLASDLAGRRGMTRELLGLALSETVKSYEYARPLLMSWGLSWGSDEQTDLLVQDLERFVADRIPRGSA